MKVVAWVVGLAVLAIGAAAVYIALNSGELIKGAVESAGSEIFGVPVSIDSVSLSIGEGSGEIRGLQIGNPAGFSGEYAMRFDQIKLVLAPDEISEQELVVNRVIIDGADVAVVVQGQRSNLQALMDNVENSTEPSTGAPEPNVIIEQFDFTNARASLRSDILGEAELDVPDVHLTDVGRESDGVTATEAAGQLLRPIAQAITEQLLAKGLGTDDLKAEAERRLREKAGEELGSELKSIAERFGHPD